MTASKNPRIIPAALISIHDVMPSTIHAVSTLLGHLEHLPPASVTLLVVPGLDWQKADIDWLAEQQQKGYQLAGHGWLHRCDKPQGIYHRLHSLVLSRNVAEHLSLSSAQIQALVTQCYHWFGEQGLANPTLYVPPAWAMGFIDKNTLSSLPFTRYETLGGIYHSGSKSFYKLPLNGYEADTRLRARCLRLSNAWNRRQANAKKLPLRIGIHPYDLHYQMADDLTQDIHAVAKSVDYQSACR